jgi:hypothetical protein
VEFYFPSHIPGHQRQHIRLDGQEADFFLLFFHQFQKAICRQPENPRMVET